VQLPSILGDNMVLQRNTNAAIWGWDTPHTQVEVTFRGKSYTTKAGSNGQWLTRVVSGAAGTGFPLSIKGTSTVALQNVAVGEVWIAGGQSNMWWHVSQQQKCCRRSQKRRSSGDSRVGRDAFFARAGRFPRGRRHNER
jgi:sialate O-acetylesterase